MTTDTLKVVADAMQSLGIEYGFGIYAGDPIVYPYFEGEYTETVSFTEDGLQESTLILMGYGRSTYMELEEEKEKIRTFFPPEGRTFLHENGGGVAISYGNAQPVPVMDAEMKRIQINLQVKEWKVN